MSSFISFGSKQRRISLFAILPAVIIAALVAVLLLVPGGSVSGDTPFFSDDFTAPAAPQWSNPTRFTPPAGRTFLGKFGNETVSLNLTNLPAHSEASVEFDLFIIRSWDGNGELTAGFPDTWKLDVTSGPTLLFTSFTNVGGNSQAFPGTHPGPAHGPRTGRDEDVNSLGTGEDTVYHLTFNFSHTASTLGLNFISNQLTASGAPSGIADESWGLDNVEVRLGPHATSAQATGQGLTAHATAAQATGIINNTNTQVGNAQTNIINNTNAARGNINANTNARAGEINNNVNTRASQTSVTGAYGPRHLRPGDHDQQQREHSGQPDQRERPGAYDPRHPRKRERGPE